MQLKNIDTRQVSVIEGPLFPNDLQKKKAVEMTILCGQWLNVSLILHIQSTLFL